MSDERIYDKIICWLQTVYTSYEYSRADFILHESNDGIIIGDWNLDIQQPTMDFVRAINLDNFVIVVPKTLIEQLQEIVARLDEIQLRVNLL